MSYDQLYKQARNVLNSGDQGQALDLLEKASACAKDAGDLKSAIAALQEAHKIAVDMNDLERAMALLDKAIAIVPASLDSLPLRNSLAIIQMHVGKIMHARETLKQALELSKGLSIPIPERSKLLNNLGFAERELGNLDGAREYHRKALEILEPANDPVEMARTLIELAIVDKDQQQLSKADASIRRAIRLLEGHDVSEQLAHALVVQALIFLLQNKVPRARSCYDKALKIYRQVGDRENEALTLHNLGQSYDGYAASEEDYKIALTYYQQSLTINREIGAVSGVAEDIGSIAGLYQIQGKYELALQMHKESLQMYEDMGFLRGQINALTDLGILAREAQRFDLAEQYFTKALQFSLEMGSPGLVAEGYRDRGDNYLAMEQYAKAIDDFAQVVEVTESMRALFQEEEALGYFDDDRLKAYSHLIRLYVLAQKNNVSAYMCLERVKSREFLRRLSVSELPRPRSVPEALLEQEAVLLAQLRQLAALLAAPETVDPHAIFNDYQSTEKQLHTVWAEIEKYSQEYIDLRHGKPVSWNELQDLLKA